jgi:predicted phage-related endonuclease
LGLFENITIEKVGVIGLFVYFALQLLDKYTNAFKSFRKSNTKDAILITLIENSNKTLERNAQSAEKSAEASNNLTNFLKAESLVNMEKAKAQVKQLETIEIEAKNIKEKVENIGKALDIHCIKCEGCQDKTVSRR